MEAMRTLNILTKLAFFALIAFSLLPLPQFEGKGMEFRASSFPLAPLALLLYWRLRRRGQPYPYLAETLILLPFIIDLFGNAANLYDTLVHYDDVCHFLNWVFLVSGLGLLIAPKVQSRTVLFFLMLGLGSITHTLWEIGEYIGMKSGAGRLFLTYEDTLGDFILSLAGSLLGALLTVALAKKQVRS